MHAPLRVGIIGDFVPQLPYHTATNEALAHAASALSTTVDIAWLPTPSLDHAGYTAALYRFDALWCAPASPYKSMQGALRAIQFARQQDWPFFGTGGGFQHTLVEYARNVLAVQEAEHEETAPEATQLILSKLTCSLVGTTQAIMLLPETLAHRAYGTATATEQFACNYGLNPAYRERIRHGGLHISGTDATGEVRLVELPTHRFFMATLFLPQLSSRPDRPHPLIVVYLRAAQLFHTSQPGRVTT